MRFCEIIPGLLNGKKYRRPNWYQNAGDRYDRSYIRMSDDILCKIEGNHMPTRLHAVSRYDLEADDWEEIE